MVLYDNNGLKFARKNPWLNKILKNDNKYYARK